MKHRRPVTLMRITPADLGSLFPGPLTFPVIAYAGMETYRKRSRLVGTGGLAWINGKCYLWLDHVDMKRTHPLVVVRMARQMLRTALQFGEEEVWVWRDEAPLSSKLIAMLGFIETEEKGLFRWQNLQPPQPS